MGISGRDYMRERSVLDGSTVEAAQDTDRPWLTWILGSAFLLIWLAFAASWGKGIVPEGSAARDAWQNLVFQPDAAEWWQPLTAMWFHDPVQVGHLLITFFLLLMFCPRAERTWGPLRLGVVIVCGSLASMLVGWGVASLFSARGWVLLGPTGGLFAVAAALAMWESGTFVAYFGRGPWSLRRIGVVAMVVAWVFLALGFEDRSIWPILPLTAGHLVSAAVGVALGRSTSESAPLPKRTRTRTRTPPVPAPEPEPETDRADDPTRERVDALLAKIADEGMSALTDEERAFLKDASKGYG
ncbi:MAG: rhomboid family intramembrane serine protease [Planctomycetota bacterium]|nr:rhomboid family intramembrane serine protease [Planctomycetota bacterium]